MSNPEDRPGGYVPWATNQGVTSQGLTNTGKVAEQSLWNGFVANLLKSFDTGQPQSGFLGDGCEPSKLGLDDNRQVAIKAGFGTYLDASASDEFGLDFVPIHVASEQTVTLDEVTPGQTRTDFIAIGPATTDAEYASRKVFSTQSQAFEVESIPTLRRRGFDLTVVKGVEGGGPPALPSGYLPVALCQLDDSGGSFALSVLDARPSVGLQAPWIGPDAVDNASLVDEAVTTAKLVDGAVTEPKIANESVTAGKLGNGSVLTLKLADKAVTTAKLDDGAVTSAKLSVPPVVPNVAVASEDNDSERPVTISTQDAEGISLGRVQRYIVRLYTSSMGLDSGVAIIDTYSPGRILAGAGTATVLAESDSNGNVQLYAKTVSDVEMLCWLEVVPVSSNGTPQPGYAVVEPVQFVQNLA